MYLEAESQPPKGSSPHRGTGQELERSGVVGIVFYYPLKEGWCVVSRMGKGIILEIHFPNLVDVWCLFV